MKKNEDSNSTQKDLDDALIMSHDLKKILFDKRLVQYNAFVEKSINTTLRPTKFPYDHYKTIFLKQRIINKLIYNLTKNIECDIQDILYLRLYEIYTIKPNKKVDGLFIRTDYLLDSDNIMKQVEINTMSCAFIFWGPVINQIHESFDSETIISDSNMQFIQFFKHIEKRTEGTVAIMVDVNTSMNTSNYHEKMLIINMFKEKGIKMKHQTFDDIRNFAKFTFKGEIVTDEDIKQKLEMKEAYDEPLEMFYDDEKVFALYYRWFYNLDHYKEDDFLLRAKLECCSAFSLPSAELQIAGMKLFQVKLTDKNYLLQFINQGELEEIYEHFGTFKSLSEIKAGDEENYILKSSLEGGGNNIFGNDILNYDGDKNSVFLMKKIVSPTCSNTFLDGKARRIIPEIGIMGWLIGIDCEILYNENAGYICRSKDENSKECGVSCGFGALDSITKKK